MAAPTILAVLTVCTCSIYGHSYYPSFSLPPPSFHQPWPVIRTYQPPLNVFSPNYDWKFDQGSFYQPHLPPFFAEPKPSNETTEKPVEQTTSSEGADAMSEEVTSSKPDANDTVSTTALSFDDIFKKTIISPEFGFVPRDPVFVSNIPVFPEYEKVVVPPRYDNFLVNHLHRLNDAYGLPGFRPFYYDESLRKLFSSNSSDDEDSKPTLKLQQDQSDDNKVADIIGVIDKMYKENPNIIVFNTKDTPFAQISDEVKTDESLDVRAGDGSSKSEKSKQDAFSQVYGDTEFLNKSFLSTVAPYYH